MTQVPTLNAFNGALAKSDADYLTATQLSSTALMRALSCAHPRIIHKLQNAAAAKTTGA
jgi:hypothetical protein